MDWDLKGKLESIIKYLEKEMAGIRGGMASAQLVEGIMVDSYGSKQPIKSVASISIPDSKTIKIQAWDQGVVPAIEKAIVNENIGLNPNAAGTTIILNLPPMTEERRKDTLKIVGKIEEEAKIRLRAVRHDELKVLKKMEDDKEISEDERKGEEKEIQKNVDEYKEKIDKIAADKKEQVMTV